MLISGARPTASGPYRGFEKKVPDTSILLSGANHSRPIVGCSYRAYNQFFFPKKEISKNRNFLTITNCRSQRDLQDLLRHLCHQINSWPVKGKTLKKWFVYDILVGYI